MKFDDFLNKGDVRRATKDENLSKSLIKNTLSDIEVFNKIKIDSKSARKLVSNYYDFLRSILEAIAIIDGYKIYSHEAFTYYLKGKNEEALSEKFERYRKIRNKVNYYGSDVMIEEAKAIIEDIKKMIDYLISKYLGEIY